MTRTARFARARVAMASALLLGAAGMLSTTPAMATTFRNAHLAGDQVVPGPGDPDAVGFADVYFAIEPEGGLVCVSWEITDMDPASSAEIGFGAPGEVGTTYLQVSPPDEEGFGGDCLVGLDPSIVQPLLDNPTGYFVQVRNDAFPDGAIRGQIQVTQTTRVSVHTVVCPGSIRTPADALAAPAGTCSPAARTSDLTDLPAGHTWTTKPVGFDMRIQLETAGQTLTLADAEVEGGFTCGPKTCTPPSFSYTWSDLTPGPMELTALTAPKGYKFGWATIGPVSDGQPAPTGTVDVAHHSISFDMTGFGDTDGVSITIYDFRGR
jgi:hypothetical protein